MERSADKSKTFFKAFLLSYGLMPILYMIFMWCQMAFAHFGLIDPPNYPEGSNISNGFYMIFIVPFLLPITALMVTYFDFENIFYFIGYFMVIWSLYHYQNQLVPVKLAKYQVWILALLLDVIYAISVFIGGYFIMPNYVA